MTDWDAIMADHGPAVWSNLWRLLANREEVEECFQETFVAALKFARRETVRSWPAVLCRLATASAMDQLRKRYRRNGRWHQGGSGKASVGDDLANVRSIDASPEEYAVAVELSERLRTALAQLPDRQADLFCLHAFCGATYRELGEQLNMTESAVGVTIHRTRQRLRILLNDGV